MVQPSHLLFAFCSNTRDSKTTSGTTCSPTCRKSNRRQYIKAHVRMVSTLRRGGYFGVKRSTRHTNCPITSFDNISCAEYFMGLSKNGFDFRARSWANHNVLTNHLQSKIIFVTRYVAASNISQRNAPCIARALKTKYTNYCKTLKTVVHRCLQEVDLPLRVSEDQMFHNVSGTDSLRQEDLM